MCGEQFSRPTMRRMLSGSPPRVRGTEIVQLGLGVVGRITPACAGNSSSYKFASTHYKDHPRVCGEQHYSMAAQTTVPGSPPRVRGTAHSSLGIYQKDRITPACAGNSTPEIPLYPVSKDHPRVCGEQWAYTVLGLYDKGSPPRVRGTG